MYLTKSPSSGIYYLWYKDTQGKKQKVSTRCKLKTDALQFIQSFTITQRDKNKPIHKTVLQFKIDFLSYAQKAYAQGTADLYERALNNFQNIIGDVNLDSITAHHWDLFKIERLKTISPVTTNIELRNLRASFNTALRWKYIQSNPFSKQKFCFVPEQSPVFFTRDNFTQLIKCITENWLREVVIFATLTGMRRGEIINLKWSDIDLQRKTLSIESNATFKTKQGKRRTIPLNDSAVFILQQKANKLFSEYVFTFNGRQIKFERLTHRFKEMVVFSKMDNKKLHFHSLRHTFASWLVQDGVSLFEVQKLLGHSNIMVTQIYSHLQPEQLHNTVNRIKISLN